MVAAAEGQREWCVCLVSFFNMVTADDSLDLILQTSPKEPI